MKINKAELRIKNAEARPRAAGQILPSAFCVRTSRSGIALIITLIMLSVTLVMAVAFIAASRRQRAAVSTSNDADTARRATESALAAAQAQLTTNIFATTNAGAFDFRLLVSTNYINAAGFVAGVQNPTNVNYDYYYGSGSPLALDDPNQNIANLFYLPRVPVFVANGGTNDFRFYLDLNRNGQFETNGLGPDFSGIAGSPFLDVDGNPVNDPTVTRTFIPTNIATTFQVGDPEWVGILERPDQPHGPENRFVGRYAFLAQPIGNSLDVNAIHNQTLNNSLGANDGYFRNQNVGSWELNFAAFFADLNTNTWGRFVGSGQSAPAGSAGYYQFNQPDNYNFGVAFDDARSLLKYRYNNNWFSQSTAKKYFTNLNNYPYGLDLYSDGPLQTTFNTNILLSFVQDNTTLPWAGADNTNRFYALPSELFDKTKVPAAFINRLQSTGARPSSYDRYTFYRMFDQLGTDSSAEDTRMNLNFDNVHLAANGTANVTNLLNWKPLGFFTNAADRLLKCYTKEWFSQSPSNYLATYFAINYSGYVDPNSGVGLTNIPFIGMTNQIPVIGLSQIPVYVDGQFVYTPAVNRLMQLAANLYDATTEDVFPSVFRPTFWVTNEAGIKNVYIDGYQLITTVPLPPAPPAVPPPPLDTPLDVANMPLGHVSRNVYGVPWIIGAKKHLPNFNRLYSLNDVAVTRKLEVTRPNNTTGPTATNEMFVMSITNHIGWSFWNSYNTNYPYGPLQVVVNDHVGMLLSNPAAMFPSSTNFYANFIVNDWPGSAWTYGEDQDKVWSAKQPNPLSFAYGTWDYDYLPEAIYRFGLSRFESTAGNPDPPFEPGIIPVAVFPEFHLWTTNQFQAYLIDVNSGRIVDYVHFDGPSDHRNIYQELGDTNSALGMMWDTNVPANVSGSTPNVGVLNQITVSRFGPGTTVPSNVKIPPQFWQAPGNIPAVLKNNLPGGEVAWFQSYNTLSSFVYGGKLYPANPNLDQQVPFTPSRVLSDYTMWQANDPLVHYLASDLADLFGNHVSGRSDDQTINPLPNPATDLYALDNPDAKFDSRYQPWGRQKAPPNANYIDVKGGEYNMAFRDSLMWTSDFWDFPTNKVPTIGWIGRVHRGTPWQTVFLKATNVLQTTVQFENDYLNIGTNSWQYWTGGNPNRFDVTHTAPLEDRFLFDLFTASPNQNAERGALSINQTHLAAWSALFSGMVAMTNVTLAVTGEFPSDTTTPVITNLVISPVGVDGTNSAIRQIQKSILATRADTNMFPLGVFTHYGDILRVPALTEKSPFIDLGQADGDLAERFPKYDISDELYEWLPQQMLGLVTLGSPRYVVYCYGQSLKPAPNGEVMSGAFTHLVTNYQVTAESAARVVLRLDNPLNTNGAPPRVIMESYTPLEPQ